MSRFVFTTDWHFAAGSNVRAGDYLKDLCDKLEYVVQFANEHDAQLLDGGDFFDKPTVPDFVKTKLIKILSKANKPILAVRGNHARLYNNDEFNDRTSLTMLAACGSLEELDELGQVEFDDCIVTSRLPLLTADKPQILIRHGFLNKEDGLNTVMLDMLQAESKALALLGHDHEVYKPVTYKKTTIYRPGSASRGIRNDSADRIPTLLYIVVEDGDFRVETYEIETAKSIELIFKDKQTKLTKTSVSSYEDIISQIKKASKTQENLQDCLKMVTDDTAIAYIDNAIEEYNNKIKK